MSKSPEQKIMELEAKVKPRETEVIFGTTSLVADKSNHFDMMIDIAEEEYKLTYENPPPRTIDHFKHKEQQTIMFACNLSGIDRHVYYRRIKRKPQGS
jgi:hypothetical protein